MQRRQQFQKLNTHYKYILFLDSDCFALLQGCIELLDRSGVTIEGKEAVVLDRSNIVGIPVALLLMQRNATVTIAHSRTKNIGESPHTVMRVKFAS